jgi:tRNA (guanosine-2'-O-)-methyltransferase
MEDPELLKYLEGFLSEARRERFRQVLRGRTRYLTVAMEDVFQLHNTSAVLRSCDVFGIQDLHLIEQSFSRRFDRKIAMGAEQWVDVYRYSNAEACLEALRKKGYRLVATTPDSRGCSLEEFRLEEPTALFFGAEKDGLSKAVLQASEVQLRIPMVGFTESLNISVAASIILYKLTTDLRNLGIPWQLTEEEILEKYMAWTKKSIKSLSGILARYQSQSHKKP